MNRAQEYGYTLQLPSHEVPDPLAYFLFTRRKGHCEYFASAMTGILLVGFLVRAVRNGWQKYERKRRKNSSIFPISVQFAGIDVFDVERRIRRVGRLRRRNRGRR